MCHSNQPEAPVPRTPRSPWRRLLRQPTKPRLSRNVVPGAKINLNRYWNKFEEVTSLRPQHALIFTAPMQRSAAVTNATDDNAINDNLVNERTEIGNFNLQLL